jgi:CRP/FNR family transcriptional regulator
MQSHFIEYEFYQEMKDEDKKILDSSVSVRFVEAGHVMRDGETECGEVPFVLNGSLRLFKSSENGREINIYHVKGGNMCSLSTLCLLGRISYAFNVEATVDSKLAFIPSHSFTVLIDKSEPFRRYVYAAIGQKLISTLDSFEALKFSSIEDRIIKYLEDNKSRNNKVYITHQELAIELGSSREVISRELRKLSKRDLIKSSRGIIELL